jgi:hypothetical protein
MQDYLISRIISRIVAGIIAGRVAAKLPKKIAPTAAGSMRAVGRRCSATGDRHWRSAPHAAEPPL